VEKEWLSKRFGTGGAGAAVVEEGERIVVVEDGSGKNEMERTKSRR